MRQTFGKTWWGENWLNALSHIDFANRIPRGATYARSGKVRSIKVNGNKIEAKVSGSCATPYTVHITVPKFSQSDTDRLMDRLLEQPAIVSKLLNRELDPAVLGIARQLNLQVFPTRWDSLEMECSCPDWAVPCKHLAAVIYMMSREIDNDPFLVFSMHGVDILAELKRRGVGMQSEEVIEVPTLESLLAKRPASEKSNPSSEFHRVDFSRLHDITEPLAALLPANPVFYQHGDFQQKYLAGMKRVARDAKRIIDGRKSLTDILDPFPATHLADAHGIEYVETYKPMLTRSDSTHFVIDDDADIEQTFDNKRDGDQPSGDSFLAALTNIPDDYLPDYDLSVSAMHQALRCALHLLACGAVVPQIAKTANKEYAIRWLPAVIDEEVNRTVESLDTIMPPKLMTATSQKAKRPYALKNQTECILSWILTLLIEKLSDTSYGDTVHHLFFKGLHAPFNGVGENAIPASIRSWTDRFFLTQRKYQPALLVSEDGDDGFLLDVAITIDGTTVPLREIMTDPAMRGERFAILKELSLLASLISGLEQHINSEGRRPIAFTTAEFAPFLFSVVPAIRLLGVKVLLPKSLQNVLHPQASVRISRRQNDGKSFLRLDQMLQFDWQVALGDDLISESEFRKLTLRAKGLIRFRQQYFYIDEEDIARLNKAFAEDKPLNSAQMLQTALTERLDRAPVTLSDDVHTLIRQLTQQAAQPVPSEIQATLRPYQERGYSWMYRNALLGFGSVIADDMGLGKTLQVITLMQRLKNDGTLRDDKHILIVVPTGLVTNWQQELQRFAPTLTLRTFHGQQRSLRNFDSDILLTTYGVLRSDAAKLKKTHWAAVIIDEAQNIKNSDTAQSKAVRSIPADLHIAMSGTPVENRLSEFWSIMDFANQGYLGTMKAFRQQYADPIQRKGDEQAAARFRSITAPFLLRRLKSDKSIISDLPDKIERNELAVLTERQAALYHETLREAMQTIEGIEATDQKSLFARQGLVLQMILALKQICNHPALFLKNGETEASLSGKTEMLLSLLESIVESGQKVLIFTQFREMGKILQQLIEQRLGERPLFLHGGCSIRERSQMVEAFQQNPRTDRIFLLSLKAAGTGLNLTAASHVIHYDLWWNPAVEAQATDRAYRIGQHQNVLVHRFITQNTFEERINQMIQDKRHLADLTVATGETWIGRLSNKELHDLFD